MNLLAQITQWVFMGMWCVAVVAHLYASRYFLPMWANRFRKNPRHVGYGRKVLVGYGVFLGAMAVGFAAGGIGELAGGWG